MKKYRFVCGQQAIFNGKRSVTLLEEEESLGTFASAQLILAIVLGLLEHDLNETVRILQQLECFNMSFVALEEEEEA